MASAQQTAGQPALRFSTFAPEPLVSCLEHVWLGVPENADDSAESICIPLTELGAHRTELLAAMVLHYGGDAEMHARALLSQWSKYYFWLAAPAAIVSILLRRPLDMSPACTRLVLRDGMPAALYFAADALQPPENDCGSCYVRLIDHLHAVIGMLVNMTRIAPRVFWGNAGNLVDYLASQCAALPGAGIAMSRLLGALSIDGEPNPLRMPVRHVQPRSALLPNPFRVRRVCCMRNEIPGETNLCASCPMLLTMRDETLALQDSVC